MSFCLNIQWQEWVLTSTFYLVSGWCDNFSLKQNEISVKKLLEVSQTHLYHIILLLYNKS